MGNQVKRNKRNEKTQNKQVIQILFLRKILRNSQKLKKKSILAKFGIGVIKYEVCSNLKQKFCFKTISSINKISKIKITYSLIDEKFQKQQLNKLANYFSSQIEQISNQTLVISGGINQNQNRFTFHTHLQEDLDFQMKYKRLDHRTNYNKKQAIYVISGQTLIDNLEIYVPHCEIFNLKTNDFSDIQQIHTPVSYFGCDNYNYKVYVFGGFNRTIQDQYLNLIQAYDSMTNNWTICSQTLTEEANTSAI